MTIRSINEINEGMQKEIDSLLHELSSTLGKTDLDRVNGLIKDGHLILFVAENKNDEIVGILTLTHCATLTGTKFWIEDVVVTEKSRGLGVGRALVRAAVQYTDGISEPHSLYLTSNPSRTAARNLYRSEGFEEYETGVFRIV